MFILFPYPDGVVSLDKSIGIRLGLGKQFYDLSVSEILSISANFCKSPVVRLFQPNYHFASSIELGCHVTKLKEKLP